MVHNKFEDRNTITVSDANKVAIIEKGPVAKTIKVALLDAGQFFGIEEAFAKFKLDRDKELELNELASNDKEVIEKRRKAKLEQEVRRDSAEETLLKNIKTIRETTMTVTSIKAEIWSVSAKVSLLSSTRKAE